MLEALLALFLNAILGGILFATQQTWLLPSQANVSGIFELVGGDRSGVGDLKLEGLGAKPAEQTGTPTKSPASPTEKPFDQAQKNQMSNLAKQVRDQPGQSGLLGLLSSSPWVALLAIAVLFPLAEELVFRGVPMFVLWLSARSRAPLERANLRRAWVLGVTAAILFSLAHGLGSTGFHLPLPQLLLGVWLWWIATRRGLGYSILAHGTYNFLPGVLALLATNLIKP